MGAGHDSAAVPAVSRLKREDYKRTKHDSQFSKWQGKEGAARYRVHNLPSSSGPGLYELGIAISRGTESRIGRDVSKLDPNDIVVVYLGQADSVRSRLQHYGRSGAHLGNNCANRYWNDSKCEPPQKGSGLFEEIFERGHSIVFRWASIKDKRSAEKTEALLLDTFDYAWNKGSNGARRPDDIIQKLSKIASSNSTFSSIAKRILFLSPGRVGIRIEANKPLSPEKCTIHEEENGKIFLKGIFKFSRSQSRLVSEKCGIDEDFIPRCGFIMNGGIPCRRPPVKGRKRCEEHKGMRIYGSSSSKSIAEGNSHNFPDVHLNSSTHDDQDHTIECGVNLGDGNFCRRQPVSGRKRCEEHKGMRVKRSVSKPIAEEKCHIPSITLVRSSSGGQTNCNASSEIDSGHRLQFQSSNGSSVDEFLSTTCGATLGNGSVCRRQPVRGNKKCWQHKGRRDGCSLSDTAASFSGFDTFTCGVSLQDGFICMRQPVRGRKRCEQHKGMRVSTSFY
ncbi:protein EFFECTOR OF TRANSCRIPTION 2 isoform X2 [Jatropha curcas]|uniref:protein EFFECTOR OF TRANSCRIPTION 2 isoform X2 n=1 Tax=Jatropha curcas TaxID=180498 RepID=UPI0005FB6ED5|nr:protein EFFECTOR OF TRANSCRIPTION 2 isoform X2 [Jatropha curcas]